MFHKAVFYKMRSGALAFFLCLALVLGATQDARANSKYASLVIDADTGVVLHQDNAGKKRYPASLTKMMTLYLAFQALESGKLSMNKRMHVSSRAAAQPPSRIGLKRGESIKVRDAIIALTVKSANDVSVVLAEEIGGSEWQFAMMMTRMAKRLGMQNTNFRNASGLHHRLQYTTAYDMARMSVALRRDYPQYYHFFRRTKFSYRGKTYRGHNRVLEKYRGADGLKTGYIRASGFNLATSVNRNGQRIVAVVLGGRSGKTRDRHMMTLLNRAYTKLAKGSYGNNRMAVAAIPVPEPKPGTRFARVIEEQKQQAAVAVSNDSGLPVPKRRPGLHVEVENASKLYEVENASVKLSSRSANGSPLPTVKPSF